LKQSVPQSSKKNAVLVELSMSGDAEAFDQLLQYWYPRWYRFCARLVGHSQDAKDVMQEAALHIATHIVRLRDPGRFIPWSYTIIRRRAADYVRSNQRQRTLKDALKVEAESAQYEATLDDSNDELANAMAKLSDDQANLVTLFYAYGLSVNELASVFDLPPGTVKSRLYTARQTLKTFYEKTGELE